jgi:RasGEF domain
MFEGSLFSSIQPWECLDLGWTKKHKDGSPHSPHIAAMISHSNQMGFWITHEILEQKDLQQRASLLKRFIKAAEQLRDMNNLNGVMEIVAGLNSSPIFRLKLTWKEVPSRLMKVYNDLNELVHPRKSSLNMRTALHNADPPCLPYLGMYLTDLVFICEGNRDLLDGGFINLEKHRMVARVIDEIRLYQNKMYDFPEIPAFMQRVNSAPSRSDDELYNLSLQVEPRARKPAPQAPTPPATGGSRSGSVTPSASASASTSTTDVVAAAPVYSIELSIAELLAQWGHPSHPTAADEEEADAVSTQDKEQQGTEEGTSSEESVSPEEKFPSHIPPPPPDSDDELADEEDTADAEDTTATESADSAKREKQQLCALVTQLMMLAPNTVREHFTPDLEMLGIEMPAGAEELMVGMDESLDESDPPPVPPKPPKPQQEQAENSSGTEPAAVDSAGASTASASASTASISTSSESTLATSPSDQMLSESTASPRTPRETERLASIGEMRRSIRASTLKPLQQRLPSIPAPALPPVENDENK